MRIQTPDFGGCRAGIAYWKKSWGDLKEKSLVVNYRPTDRGLLEYAINAD